MMVDIAVASSFHKEWGSGEKAARRGEGKPSPARIVVKEKIRGVD
jgi:hypothetical protein